MPLSSVAKIPTTRPAFIGAPGSEPTNTPVDVTPYKVCQAEWALLLSEHQGYSDLLDDMDMMACSFDQLADLIEMAPTVAIRHTVREAAQCRREMMTALRLAVVASDSALAVFARCDQEWEALLDEHPVYKRWLAMRNRLNCSREIANESMRRAPNLVIRHAMRQHYLFRLTAALHTPYGFA